MKEEKQIEIEEEQFPIFFSYRNEFIVTAKIRPKQLQRDFVKEKAFGHLIGKMKKHFSFSTQGF